MISPALHQSQVDLTALTWVQDDPKYKQALRVKNPEARLRAFLAICGSMRTDDSGGQQPKYRMDTFRIMAEFEKPKVCPPCCISPASLHAMFTTCTLA